MKRYICLLLSVLMLFSAFSGALPAAAETQTSVDGRLSVSDGILTVKNGSDVIYYTKQSFSGDRVIEMRAAVQNQAIGLIFGSGSPNPCMWSLALVQPYGLWAHMPGNWSDIRKISNPNVKQNQFVTLKIVISGTAVTTYINDEKQLECTIPAAQLNGPLGLRFSSRESGMIDYIHVDKDGKRFWEDNFDMIDTGKWNFPAVEQGEYEYLDECMEPMWSGDVAYREGLWPIANQDGSIDDMKLMYRADEILSVTNSRGTVTYTEGKDYQLVDGKLRIPSGSSIAVTSYNSYYPSSGAFPKTGGGYIFWSEGSGVTDQQIAVTYRHSDSWDGFTPEDKSSLLPKTNAKLANGENLKIVYYGDSITEGYNASSFVGVEPNMPIWSKLVTQSLRKTYPSANITEVNTGLSGQTAQWGIQNVQDRVVNYHPDLVVIAFGMNDGSSRSPEAFTADLQAMMDAVRKDNPNCEFVLVSTTMPNPEGAGRTVNHGDYEAAMLKMEQAGVAVTQMTSLHKYLLTEKRYCDMTGNNVNHPNDWLVRCYAQSILRTIQGDSIDTVYSNLNYVDGSTDPYQTLDIKLPNGGKGPFPVVVYAHGGAWVIGDKTGVDEARVFLDTALSEGYAVVSINYRLAQNAQWPAQIYDYKAAVRYLRANAEKYHLDPDRIAAAGASAGAHLSLLMGTTNGKAEYEDLSMGNAEFSSDVQIVISQYGISDLTQWSQGRDPGNWMTNLTPLAKPPITILLGDNYTEEQAKAASAYYQADENTVPMILAHGQNDNLVEPEHSHRMEEKLKSLMDPELVDTYYPENGPHGDGNYWNRPEPVQKLMNFLNKRFMPEKNIDSDENTRPGYWHVDLSGYSNKYLNLKYADESNTQKLHLILPEEGEGPYKTIVFVHGGGFRGSNSSGTQVLYTAEGPLQAVEKGYAVALVDYRCSPEGHFPQPIYDVKAAIRYLRANAEKYGLDGDKFAIWGESAGGLIADLVGTTNGNPEYEDLSMGNAEFSSEVQAVVSWYAITDMTTDANAQYRAAYLGQGSADASVQKNASPLYQVTKDAPAFYIQHGMADNEVEYSDSVRLYDALMEASGNKNNKLELFPGLTHAVKKFISKENVDKIVQWLDGALVYTEPEILKGDVDDNGVVNVSDIMTLKNLIMNNSWDEGQLARGDIDNNDTLNVSDMLSIKSIIMNS